MLRTKTCGELTAKNIGETVTLTGWVSKVRNLGALVFVDLRDRYGITQLNINPELYEANQLKSEYCIRVTGKVAKRTEANKELSTGEIEVLVESYSIFAKSELPPFIIADKTDALEDTRLVNRYLDLRRPVLQHNLIVRHKLLKAARDYLENINFLEIETPTLVKSTPEGARDYLVPSRTKKGSFYALPQSPQIYKQLLMIGGMDRYYQVARCYRDEDLRADRQPEFTQIDVEMSFGEREDILNIIEGLVKHIFKQAGDINLPDFKRISYKDVIDLYGSDKPDMRFDMLLNNVSDLLADAGFEGFNGKVVKAICVSNEAKDATRKTLDGDNELVKKFKLHSVFHFKVSDGKLNGSATKFFSEETLNSLKERLNAKDGDLIIVGANEDNETVSTALGAVRLKYARKLGLCDFNVYVPLFVTDWPLFGRENDQIVSLSNPFTRPRDEDLKYLDEDPTKVLSYAYDTVINGVEISSGSLRIYDGSIQKKVFELLGLNDQEIKEKFGFFVDAFNYGTPPHGGFALGVERMAMLLCQTENVRDVVAFPKNLNACCPMCGAPSVVPTENLDLLGIAVKGEKDE